MRWESSIVLYLANSTSLRCACLSQLLLYSIETHRRRLPRQLIGVLYSWLILLSLPDSTLQRDKPWTVRSLHEYLNGSPKALATFNGTTVMKKGPGRLASELASSDFEKYFFPLSTGGSPYERQFLSTAFEALEMDLIHYLDQAVKIDVVHRDAKGTMGW